MEKGELTLVEPNNSAKEMELLSKTLGNTMGNFFEDLSGKTKYENVGIFVDYDNVYWTLMKQYQHDPDNDDVTKNIFSRLWEEYGRDNVRCFKAFADFEAIRTQLTSLQKKRVQIRHVYSKGKDDQNKKNSSDIELCLDVIESTYKDDKISCYVIVTADSDMIPVLSRLMYKGKKVELYYLSSATSSYTDITSYAHKSVDLLNFLNVQQKEYEIDEYVIKALQFIDGWCKKYQGNDNVWLGQSWLKSNLPKEIQLPEIYVSELLEKLDVEEFIQSVNKETKQGKKSSIEITEKAKELLLGKSQDEIASSQEE